MSEADKNRITELEDRLKALEDKLSGDVVELTPSEAAKILRKVNTDNNPSKIETKPKVKIKEKK